MSINRFNWRTLVSAPNNQVIVGMSIITHVGGWARPIDIRPDMWTMQWRDGYWRYADRDNGENIIARTNLTRAFWTTTVEYEVAMPRQEWRQAPSHVDGFICCPLVFVRPTEPLYEHLSRRVYAADVVWPHGNTKPEPERWSTVSRSGPGEHCHPRYLDGENVLAKPFRWCTLSWFFPQQVFDELSDQERRVSEYRCRNIAMWGR